MAGKGAPKENQYARKEPGESKAGRTIGLYITFSEWEALRGLLEKEGTPVTDQAIAKRARKVFKDGILKEEKKKK